MQHESQLLSLKSTQNGIKDGLRKAEHDIYSIQKAMTVQPLHKERHTNLFLQYDTNNNVSETSPKICYMRSPQIFTVTTTRFRNPSYYAALIKYHAFPL